MNLTEAKVKNAAPGRHTDGRGLILFVQKTGSRSWIFRYRARAAGATWGFGSWPDVSLAMARARRDDARRLMAEGRDPIARKRRAKTFREAAIELVEKKRAGWKSKDSWTPTLEKHVFPAIGDMDVAEVGTPDVVAVVEPIWTTTPETASRVRQRIEAVIDYATAMGFRHGDNPARWTGKIEHVLPNPRDVRRVEHHSSLPYANAAGFMTSLAAREGVAARALAFTILTAARSGETREMTWGEVDLDARTWTVPAGRMKSDREHRVPLSGAAIALLGSRGDDAALVFGRNDRPISHMAMPKVLDRMGQADITVHGFRSTFRDWAGETTDFPREVIERALAHVVKDKAEAAYARSDLVEKRRELMDAWARAISPANT